MIVKAPSKLYISGEYAVLNKGSYAVIASIPKYTYLEITKSDTEKVISNVEDKDNILKYARQVAFLYVGKYETFEYRYSTDLYHNNMKLGLGSSASVVVVTIKAILEYYKAQYTKDELFLLSVKALKMANIKGSMGDVACICYDDLIFYKSIDLENLDYEIRKINLKEYLNIKAIWTGVPVSTSNQIKDMNNIMKTKEFTKFNEISNRLTLKLVNIFENGNDEDISKVIEELVRNLRYFEKISNIKIYNDMIDNIISNNVNCKTSGAGLGDFLISLTFDKVKNIKKDELKYNIDFVY